MAHLCQLRVLFVIPVPFSCCTAFVLLSMIQVLFPSFKKNEVGIRNTNSISFRWFLMEKVLVKIRDANFNCPAIFFKKKQNFIKVMKYSKGTESSKANEGYKSTLQKAPDIIKKRGLLSLAKKSYGFFQSMCTDEAKSKFFFFCLFFNRVDGRGESKYLMNSLSPKKSTCRRERKACSKRRSPGHRDEYM